MKPLIGMLCGTSWSSTISYYEELNRQIQYPRLLLYSIDYGRIKPLYNHANNWGKISHYLKEEVELITSKGIDSLIICNNTLHKAFDMVELSLNLKIPVHHAGKLAAKKAQTLGAKKVLLMATKFTMQDGFYAKYFTDAKITVILPNLQEMEEIQAMQTQLASGNLSGNVFIEFAQNFDRIIKNNPADAICFACTELPLAVKNTQIPIINPMIEQILNVLEIGGKN